MYISQILINLKNLQSGLGSLKSKVHKLNIGKLENTAVDLSKLIEIVKNEVIKKIEYNAKIKDIEDKLPDITNLAKINNVKGKILKIND